MKFETGIPGAWLRYVLGMLLNPKENGFFYGTFAANMIAVTCLALFNRYGEDWNAWGYALEEGFCSDLSTVSTFINDVFKGFSRASEAEQKAREKVEQERAGEPTQEERDEQSAKKSHEEETANARRASVVQRGFITTHRYFAGYWPALSPIVYIFTTIGVGCGIVAAIYFTSGN